MSTVLRKRILFIFIFSLLPSFGATKINVITTSNELRWLAEEIGGQRVQVESLLSGHEDPHYIDAVPSHIQKVSRADVVCSIGLELEVGWLPKVLSRSGNRKVQRNNPGFCEGGSSVETLSSHEGEVDRSMGDVHPSGNPHYWISPPHLAQASKSVLDALLEADTKSAEYFLENHQRLLEKISTIEKRVGEILKDLPDDFKVSEYHKEFFYFFNTYGIKSGETIEEVPGSPPSAGRIARVALQAKENGTHMALASTNHPRRHLKRFSDISGVPFVQHPPMMQDSGDYSDYEYLLTSLAKSLVQTAEQAK